MSGTNGLEGREIIIEFIPVGVFVRVTAVDVATMTEVYIQGPKTAVPSLLKANAIKRLAYVLRKNGIIADA